MANTQQQAGSKGYFFLVYEYILRVTAVLLMSFSTFIIYMCCRLDVYLLNVQMNNATAEIYPELDVQLQALTSLPPNRPIF